MKGIKVGIDGVCFCLLGIGMLVLLGVGVVAERKDGYTKTEINRMSVAELRDLAKENGIFDADEMNGSDLKKMLIEKLV